jgi:hypothetical protein
VQTAGNGGSKLLIFVPAASHIPDLPLSWVAPFGASKLPKLAPVKNAERDAEHGMPLIAHSRPATGELISSHLRFFDWQILPSVREFPFWPWSLSYSR